MKKPKQIRKLKDVTYLTLDISIKKNLKKLKNIKFNYVINSGGHVDHYNEKKVISIQKTLALMKVGKLQFR